MGSNPTSPTTFYSLQIWDKNSSYGSIWIYNETLQENKKVKKELVDEFLNEGWMVGRKMEYHKKWPLRITKSDV